MTLTRCKGSTIEMKGIPSDYTLLGMSISRITRFIILVMRIIMMNLPLL